MRIGTDGSSDVTVMSKKVVSIIHENGALKGTGILQSNRLHKRGSKDCLPPWQLILSSWKAKGPLCYNSPLLWAKVVNYDLFFLTVSFHWLLASQSHNPGAGS